MNAYRDTNCHFSAHLSRWIVVGNAVREMTWLIVTYIVLYMITMMSSATSVAARSIELGSILVFLFVLMNVRMRLVMHAELKRLTSTSTRSITQGDVNAFLTALHWHVLKFTPLEKLERLTVYRDAHKRSLTPSARRDLENAISITARYCILLAPNDSS
jgi:hypothetical protein